MKPPPAPPRRRLRTFYLKAPAVRQHEEDEDEAEVENFQDVEAEAEREELKRFDSRRLTTDELQITMQSELTNQIDTTTLKRQTRYQVQYSCGKCRQ
ncbi:hypothetical protein T05_10836 [Trichinella murrelli]|uniref:Uncharacterized protein n=1 Tax=Trichinella murrelli TaxID=144512 RepID=A0A0V0U8W6_9BILA|nr:hypothetical protein T05_10836 [Trichinella murrelli]